MALGMICENISLNKAIFLISWTIYGVFLYVVVLFMCVIAL